LPNFSRYRNLLKPGATTVVSTDFLVELRGFEPRCSWQCPRLTAPRARRSVRQQLDSETFVVPERQCDAVAKGVEKVVLAVASWIADTKTFDLL
jgi:hypothetical protein